jgi:hypothetical protein
MVSQTNFITEYSYGTLLRIRVTFGDILASSNIGEDLSIYPDRYPIGTSPSAQHNVQPYMSISLLLSLLYLPSLPVQTTKFCSLIMVRTLLVIVL